MQTLTKHFNDQPVKMMVGGNVLSSYFNLVDLAKILEKDHNEFLNDPEIKEWISFFENSSSKDQKQEYIIIESSQEIYLHHAIIIGFTPRLNKALCIWSFDASDEAREEFQQGIFL